ncbi:MAG: endolytic transglycosylase MltG [Endomicrobium sp.]|jgi:UPF0755 protein|nr:endolytic transglycosylase MltG [Endomicrobium sp.]
MYNKSSLTKCNIFQIHKGYYSKFTFLVNKFIIQAKNNKHYTTIRVTVPEGQNIYQTAECIYRTFPINKNKFVRIAQFKKMEGYLMPETYFLTVNMNESQIIDMMYKEFKNKITNSMYKRAHDLNLNFNDVIILASIIEKEVSNSDERRIVASIFYNRLNRKIKLQSCATVLYAIGLHKVKLSLNDTKINSPYNTYKYFGLPPGPICSPSLDSIKAALYPKLSRKLFFVSQGNGKHLFAKNFEEHKKNKQIIKRELNEKKKNLSR